MGKFFKYSSWRLINAKFWISNILTSKATHYTHHWKTRQLTTVKLWASVAKIKNFVSKDSFNNIFPKYDGSDVKPKRWDREHSVCIWQLLKADNRVNFGGKEKREFYVMIKYNLRWKRVIYWNSLRSHTNEWRRTFWRPNWSHYTWNNWITSTIRCWTIAVWKFTRTWKP